MGDFIEFVGWFCFDPTGARPNGFGHGKLWDTLAFSLVAAVAFVGFVIIGSIATYVRAHGPNAVRSGEQDSFDGKFWLAMLLGAVAAFLVGVIASLVNLFQINVQTAVVSGVTWQLIYARMTEQFVGAAGQMKLRTPAGGVETQQAASEEQAE